MCVIAINETTRMTEAHVKKMFGQNKDGAGIAWRENGRVQWRKGLSEEEMKDLCLTVPLPFVAHFRIASCGGIKPELTHPFPIMKEVPLALKGSSLHPVMFHNGHYSMWEEKLLNFAINNGVKIPTGAWSDSRFMAMMGAYCGLTALPFFREKIVAFGLEDMDIWGSGWAEVDGLYVSNRSWEHTHTTHHYPNQGYRMTVCRYKQCKVESTADSIWCADHQGGKEKEESKESAEVVPIPRTFRGGDQSAIPGSVEQKTVETVAQSLRGGRAEGQELQTNHPTLNENLHAWVARLNPKKYRTHSVVPSDDDTMNDPFPYVM